MGREYGKTPSEMLKRPIDEFLYDWNCTLLLREREHHDQAARSSVVSPPRMEFDEWSELVKEDMKREKAKELKEKRKKQRHNKLH